VKKALPQLICKKLNHISINFKHIWGGT